MSDTPWRNFWKHELQCKCCGKIHQTLEFADFMDTMQLIRDETGIKMPVTSGCRCEDHDRRVGSSSRAGKGPHTIAAIDVAVSGENAFRLVEAAVKFGVRGIGVSQRGGKPRFLHFDMLEENRPRIWSY